MTSARHGGLAKTPAEGADRGALRLPAAAIIELVLPDGDGVEVRRRLREWSTMPVILLSIVVVRAGLERAHLHLLIAHVTLSRVDDALGFDRQHDDPQRDPTDTSARFVITPCLRGRHPTSSRRETCRNDLVGEHQKERHREGRWRPHACDREPKGIRQCRRRELVAP